MAGVAVYLGYDRAELDDQYTARPRIPDYDSYLARWPEESARSRRQLSLIADVAYGPDIRETYDVFPAGAGSPIHVFFHGGYWYSQDKTVFEFIAPTLVGGGATVVCVNYPLCPEVRLAALVASCRTAIADIWRRAEEWGADPDCLYVAGHSAGGHIAAILMSTKWQEIGPELPADMVKGGLAMSGLYDLEPLRLCYVNDWLRLTKDEAEAMSPLRHLPETASELLFAVGGQESEEFHRQQSVYAQAWRDAGLPGLQIDMPGFNHFSIVDDYAAADGVLAGVALRQMGLNR